jgi:IMP cyclohydrolase
LLALDFEKDDYDTPRVAGVVRAETATIGTVRRDALLVEAVDEPTMVATYEADAPARYDLAASDAAAAASEVLGADFEHPVCAAGATVDSDGVSLAVDNDN